MTATVDSFVSGNLTFNGIDFGLSSNGTDFRPGGLYFQIDANEDPSGMISSSMLALGNGNAAGFGINEASLYNGFTIQLVANSSGFTFTITDALNAADLSDSGSFVYSESYAGNEFVDNYGGLHMYFTAQTAGNTNANINFFEFSIQVDEVPEPSSVALVSLGFLALLSRRKRLS